MLPYCYQIDIDKKYEMFSQITSRYYSRQLKCIVDDNSISDKYGFVYPEKYFNYRNNMMCSFYKNKNKVKIGIQLSKNTFSNIITSNLPSEIIIDVCVFIEHFINKYYPNLSKYIYNHDTKEGFIRDIQIRHNLSNQFYIMINTISRLNKLINFKSIILDLYNYFRLHFKNGQLVNIYIKYITPQTPAICNDIIPSPLIYDNYLHIDIFDKTLIISPNSFFQTNYDVAKEMYIHIQKIIGTNEQSDLILLDLFCGVGVYGSLFGEYFDKIVGIDINSESIRYALTNIKNNVKKFRTNQEKFKYICGDINKHIDTIINECDSHNAVVIVNPNRSGLKKTVCSTLIEMSEIITKIIYVSCNIESLKSDMDILSSTFTITSAMGFNQFPLIDKHFETIIVLERSCSPSHK